MEAADFLTCGISAVGEVLAQSGQAYPLSSPVNDFAFSKIPCRFCVSAFPSWFEKLSRSAFAFCFWLSAFAFVSFRMRSSLFLLFQGLLFPVLFYLSEGESPFFWIVSPFSMPYPEGIFKEETVFFEPFLLIVKLLSLTLK